MYQILNKLIKMKNHSKDLHLQLSKISLLSVHFKKYIRLQVKIHQQLINWHNLVKNK